MCACVRHPSWQHGDHEGFLRDGELYCQVIPKSKSNKAKTILVKHTLAHDNEMVACESVPPLSSTASLTTVSDVALVVSELGATTSSMTTDSNATASSESSPSTNPASLVRANRLPSHGVFSIGMAHCPRTMAGGVFCLVFSRFAPMHLIIFMAPIAATSV